MVSSSTYALLRIAGWSYLPDMATRQLLSLLHSSPLIKPPPLPGTPKFIKHYRLTFSSVILAFLLYNLVEASRAMPPNFYEILRVGPDADDNTLRVAFRNFAKRNHPDRPEVGEAGAELFREVRDAFEALRNPVVRFAYDRFGPDVLSWTQCTTTSEYLRHGLMQSSGYHIVTGVGLLFFSAVGKPSSVAFWRYLLFAALFASELALLLSPSPSNLYTSPHHITPHHTNILTSLFPHRVAYQHIQFLHQLFMFISIAISRVAPVLAPVVREWIGLGAEEGLEVVGGMEGLGRVIERIGGMVRAADRELYLMLHTEVHSIQAKPRSASFTTLKPLTQPDEAVMDALTNEMQNMIIENKLKKEAPLKTAWEGAVMRGERVRAVTEGRTNGHGKYHPLSPISPLPGKTFGLGDVQSSPGRLPSPRPSPPPPPTIVRRGSSYVRARSVSC